MEDEKLPAVQKKMKIKQAQAQEIRAKHRIVRFMGAVLEYTSEGWKNLTSDDFSRICYGVHGAGITKSQIQDLEHLFFTSSEDVSERFCFIAMPDGRVWDTKKLKWTDKVSSEDCIFTTFVSPTDGNSHREWLEQVTLGDKDLANDIMWAIAPILMHKKPFGVFWFLGGGGNGKSTVLETVYEIFGGKKKAPFTQLSLTSIEDGRDIPTMNGKLGNICVESHDGHIKDAGNYKHLAEHDDLEEHKMRTNSTIKVNGNIHTIFNTNNIPTFGDKSKAIRDRTYTIPFKAQFERDPNFNENLWSNPNFLSDFLGELLSSAQAIKKNGYKYKLSTLSINAKSDYDEEANSAEAYFNELVSQDIIGFTSHDPLYKDYENWCKERGSIQLGRKTLATAGKALGYERRGFRPEGRFIHRYSLEGVIWEDMKEIPQRWGLFQRVDSNIDLAISETTQQSIYDQLMEIT